MTGYERAKGNYNSRAELINYWLSSRQDLRQDAISERRDHSVPRPASFGQRQLWLQDQIDDLNGDRNISFAWYLDGSLSVHALFDALDEIIERHEVLRTVFDHKDGELVQWTGESYALDRAVVSARPDELAMLVEEAAHEPFDLECGRLLRGRLFRLADSLHVLLLTVPHLVIDDWSVGVLHRELSACYAAIAADETPKLPALPAQYGDFVDWQRRRLESGANRDGVDYWLAVMADMPAVIQMPTNKVRGSASTHRSRSISFDLSDGTVRSIDRFCGSQRATSFMVLLAAYGVLVSRWSDSDDLVIGSPFAGRTSPQFEPLIGFFVNTLPLRLRIDHRQSFSELVSVVRDIVLSAMEHQDVPVDHLINQVAGRKRAGTPVAQIAFSLNSSTGELPELAGLDVSRYEVPSRSSRWDIGLAMVNQDNGLHGELIYDEDLFDALVMNQFVCDYEEMLETLLARPNEALYATEKCNSSQLSPTNILGPARDFDNSLNVGHRVATYAKEMPDNLAVKAPDGAYTFDELDRRADFLAVQLLDQGIASEDVVGVHLGQSRNLVAALLAIWKVGAVFLPLDPSIPAERLHTIADDSGIAALIGPVDSVLATDGIPHIDSDSMASFQVVAEFPAHESLSLAYIIYTSGSTGEPKGVGITYRNLANFVTAIVPLVPQEYGVNILPSAFDGWLWSTLIPLAHGRTVVLVDPLDLTSNVLAESTDLISITPSLLAAHDPLPDGEGPRVIVVAGEPCQPGLAARWSAGRRFVNVYGQTETTICATWSDTAAGGSPQAIGYPLPNYQARVLDSHLRLVRQGAVGELFIAGAGVGRGYRNLAGQTAARFLPDPFAHGERMYRTGDLVRVKVDGSLEYVARVDEQLKVRGFRVEPAEVRRIAERVPGVRTCATFEVHGSAGRSLGLCLVVEDADEIGLETTVRRALEQTLPEYMVPAHIIQSEVLPVTSTGKTDGTALARLWEQSAKRPICADILTATQRLVASVWSEVLQQPVERVDDDFFELGGHSVLAVRVVSKLRLETGQHLTIRQLFSNRTVGALAERIAKHSSGEGS